MIDKLAWLIVLALPTACVSWTVTREEIFREPRDWLAERSRTCRYWWQRAFCYVWTCDYCFSHYVAAAFVILAGFKLLLNDWRGYLVAWLSLVAVANVFLSAYSRLRVELRKERVEVQQTEARAHGMRDERSSLRARPVSPRAPSVPKARRTERERRSSGPGRLAHQMQEYPWLLPTHVETNAVGSSTHRDEAKVPY